MGVAAAALGAVAVHDLAQKKHALKRNFPVIAHARYLLEKIGPELRQYIVTNNEEERPFNRDQRTWIYASSKEENNYFGFGTDVDIEHTQGHAYIKHRTFARELPDDHDASASLPSAKVLGGPRGRTKAFRPSSVVNVSAMSFGSMSGAAIKALNTGVKAVAESAPVKAIEIKLSQGAKPGLGGLLPGAAGGDQVGRGGHAVLVRAGPVDGQG